MKKVIIVILCGIVIFSISVCSCKISGDEVVFNKIDPSLSNDSILLKTLVGDLEDGVYSLQTDKGYYIIFNGRENIYKDIQYGISGKTFEILFSKEQNAGNSQIVYEVALPKNIDTIKLLQDGENIPFESVII